MKVSVIIPAYNAAQFIRRAVDSVMNQTYRQWELVCVNDGSTDNTLEILKELQLKHNNSFTILDLHNRGACAARNAGIKSTDGEYVQFLDADDELLPEKIASSVACLSPGTAMVAGVYKRKSGGHISDVNVDTGDVWLALFNGQLGCTCSNLFRRAVLVESGLWNETMKSSQEAELMLRVLRCNDKVAYDTHAYTVVHTGDSIISRSDEKGNLQRYFEVRLNIFDEVVKQGRRTDIIVNAGYMFYGILHRMYKTDKELALQMHSEIVNRSIAVTKGPGVSGKFRTLCSIFGFPLTEKIFY